MSKISVGVGAVVFKGDDVLLIKRGKPPFQGQWSIPGGSLEYGENLVAGVQREVREETGISIDRLALIDVFEALPGTAMSDRHFLMIDYVAQWVSGVPVAGDDASDALFVPIAVARQKLSWDTTRQALGQALEIRNDILKRP